MTEEQRESCAVCGSTGRSCFKNGNITLVTCNQCGTIREKGRQSKKFKELKTLNKVIIGVFKLNENAKLPVFAREGDACADLYLAEDKVIRIDPGEMKVLKTGLAFALPSGYEAQIRSRSSIPLKMRLMIANGIGTIDEHYTDEVCVLVFNAGQESVMVDEDMRIAQVAIRPVPKVEFVEITRESYFIAQESSRGGGLGSTGDKEIKTK
jgi:dUTP pyrophosphatase